MKNGGITEFRIKDGWLVIEMTIDGKRHGYIIDAPKLKEILESNKEY